MWRIAGMTSHMAPHLGSYCWAVLAVTLYLISCGLLNLELRNLQFAIGVVIMKTLWSGAHAALPNLVAVLFQTSLNRIWHSKIACLILQVYEDDVERNYQLLIELLIALKDSLREDGLPFVKDLQAIWILMCHLWTYKPLTKTLGAWCPFLDWGRAIKKIWWLVHTSLPNQCLHPGWLFAGDVDAQLAQAPLHQEGWENTNQGAMDLFFTQLNWLSPWLSLTQDWAAEQATRTRSVLGHLHSLSRKAASSRRGSMMLRQITVWEGIWIYRVIYIISIYIK